MQTGVIVRRNAGLLVPLPYIEKAIAENPRSWGVAISSDGELLTNKGNDPTVELLTQTMKDYDKNDITFFLSTGDTGVNNGDDVSPYTILSKDNKPLLLAFIEGNFQTFAKTGSSHPPEFFFANDITQKLQALLEMADGDISKVMGFIKKPHFKTELLINAVDRGAVTFMTAAETLSLSQGEGSSEYPWGWVSNNYGYAIGPKVTAKEEVPKPKGMFPSKSTVREKAAVPPSNNVAAVVTPPKTEATVIKNYTKEKVTPDRKLSRQEKKKWYKNRIGYLPEGWVDNVSIEVYKSPEGNLLTIGQVKATGLSAVGLPALNNPPRLKDTSPDNVPEQDDKPVDDKQVTDARIPIMSPATREHLQKIMKDAKTQKLIADNASIMSDPKEVQKLEAKFQNFCMQLGITKMDQFMSWSYPMMYDLAKEKPDGIAVMCFNFRNMLLHHMLKAAPEVEVVEQEVQPEPVVAKPRGMFPAKKVA